MKFLLLFFVIPLLLGCKNETKVTPPLSTESTTIYFFDKNDKSLLDSINVTPIKNTAETLSDKMFIVDSSEYKIKVFFDDEENINPGSSLKMGEDKDGDKYLILSMIPLPVFDHFDDMPKVHTIRYELYCPRIFGNKDYHMITVACSSKGYEFKQEKIYLENKEYEFIYKTSNTPYCAKFIIE